ncbi:MAG: homocysteine S-methyltransferase family protein [Rhodomicrobium sp.]
MKAKQENFSDFVSHSSFVLFAGAMGTELQRRGYKTALPLWSAAANFDAPSLVEEIHDDYFGAGADVAIANTFRTTPRAFRKVGRESEARRALDTAVSIALRSKENAGRRAFVGGSFAPLEDCYRPDLVPGETELRDEHTRHAAWLAEAGVDFLLPETINAGLEAKIMAEAAAATGLPFIISFVVDSGARLLDGTPLAKVIESTALPGRIGVSLNCRPLDTVDAAFQALAAIYDGPIGLYPNGVGHAHDDLGWRAEGHDDGVAEFVESALQWKSAGAKIVGGCCGTTPGYIRALHKEMRKGPGESRPPLAASPRAHAHACC